MKIMERNNFISRIKVEQNINYNKLIWFQKEIEQFDIKKIHCLIPILKKMSNQEKVELEKMYKEQIIRLKNEIRKAHLN